MIEETRGRIDYDECGSGPTVTAFPYQPQRSLPSKFPFSSFAGGESPQAMQRASALVSERTRGSTLATIDGAAHFMIATHASGVAGLIAQHVYQAEARQNVPV